MKTQTERYRAWATQQAADWFVAHRSGQLSAMQRRAFARWLRISPLHVAEYLAIARAAHDVAAQASHVAASLDQLLGEAAGEERVVQLPTPANIASHSGWTSAVSRFAAAASRSARSVPAAITVCLALAIGVWLWAENLRAPHGSAIQYRTAAGQDRTVKLADETIMYLTANSAVRVGFDAHRRLVEVERGQALFEVAHDAGRPFEVRARNSVIEDVGTVFDVIQDSQKTVVTVLEGQVAVWTTPGSPVGLSDRASPAGGMTPVRRLKISLDAGEQARILSTGTVTTRRPHDLARAAPWLEPQIAFDQERLAAVAAEFNRHNRVKIEVTDPRIAAIPVSGVFHSYDVASFASFLSNLNGVQAQMVSGRLQVSATADPGSSMPRARSATGAADPH